jgi:hypothetical protein
VYEPVSRRPDIKQKNLSWETRRPSLNPVIKNSRVICPRRRRSTNGCHASPLSEVTTFVKILKPNNDLSRTCVDPKLFTNESPASRPRFMMSCASSPLARPSRCQRIRILTSLTNVFHPFPKRYYGNWWQSALYTNRGARKRSKSPTKSETSSTRGMTLIWRKRNSSASFHVT